VTEKDSIANSTEAQEFREAVQKGDVWTAWYVFIKGNDKLKECCGKHLVSLERSGLVELIKGAEDHKDWVLKVILVHADQSLINEVFAAIKPTNRDLCYIACIVEVACIPNKFLYLLGRISDKGDQERALKSGVCNLISSNKTEYLDPLFFALQDETSLDPGLTNIAIRAAFHEVSCYTDDRSLYAKRLFDHSSISAKNYSDALYRSYYSGDPKKRLFHWLLARADHQDLEEARRNDEFSSQSSEFQVAVNEALEDAVGTEARIGITLKRIEIIASLKNVIPKDLLNIILGYFLSWQLDPSESL